MTVGLITPLPCARHPRAVGAGDSAVRDPVQRERLHDLAVDDGERNREPARSRLSGPRVLERPGKSGPGKGQEQTAPLISQAILSAPIRGMPSCPWKDVRARLASSPPLQTCEVIIDGDKNKLRLSLVMLDTQASVDNVTLEEKTDAANPSSWVRARCGAPSSVLGAWLRSCALSRPHP